jgi:hypothetical protein
VRIRVPILVKLLLALVLPVVILFALFAVVAYEVSQTRAIAVLRRPVAYVLGAAVAISS